MSATYLGGVQVLDGLHVASTVEHLMTRTYETKRARDVVKVLCLDSNAVDFYIYDDSHC